MLARKGYVTAGRFEIPYRISGNGPDVFVCINGALQSMASWQSFISYFRNSYSIAVYDAPGQGRAKTLSGPTSVTLEEQFHILDRIVELAAGDGRIDLGAASWGTVIGAGFAARRSSRVKRMILGGFAVKTSARMLDMIERGKCLVNTRRSVELGDLLIEEFGSRLPDRYKRLVRRQASTMSEDQIRHFYAQCEAIERIGDLREVVNLEDISAETLVVNGEFDTLLGVEDLATAQSLIPRCREKVARGVGHFLHLENPEVFGLYENFLGSRA